MTDEVKKFLKFACENDELQGKLSAHYSHKGEDKSIDYLIELAAEKGYKFFPEDFAVEDNELDTELLMAVAGGMPQRIGVSTLSDPRRSGFGS